jgi:hypothetical protein
VEGICGHWNQQVARPDAPFAKTFPQALPRPAPPVRI